MLSRALGLTGNSSVSEDSHGLLRLIVFSVREEMKRDRCATKTICVPQKIYLPEIASSVQFLALPSQK